MQHGWGEERERYKEFEWERLKAGNYFQEPDIHTWKVHMEKEVKETGWQDVEWIHLALFIEGWSL